MTPRIEEWKPIVEVPEGRIRPTIRISGRIYDHPTEPDGDWFKTGNIMGRTSDMRVRCTGGKYYILGQVDEDFKMEFPFAERVLNRLKVVK